MSSFWGAPASKARTAATIRSQSAPTDSPSASRRSRSRRASPNSCFVRVEGLGHAVGEDDEEIAAGERRRRLAVVGARERPERRSRGREPLDCARSAHEHRGVVAGVDPGQRPSLLVEDGPEERRETVRFGQSVELGVELGDEARLGRCRPSRAGARLRREPWTLAMRRAAGSPLPATSPTAMPVRPGFERKEVVVVAGDALRREADAMAFEAGDLRVPPREEPGLDLWAISTSCSSRACAACRSRSRDRLSWATTQTKSARKAARTARFQSVTWSSIVRVGVVGEHVLPHPEQRGEGGAEKPAAAARRTTRGRAPARRRRSETRARAEREVVEEGEGGDPEEPDRRPGPNGAGFAATRRGASSRRCAPVQYAFRSRRPCRSVIHRILMSSESDQFSM